MRPDQITTILQATHVTPAITENTITNRLQITRALDELSVVPSFATAVNVVKKHLQSESFDQGSADGDVLLVKNRDGLKRLNQLVDELMLRKKHILAFLRDTYPPEPDNAFYIEFPGIAHQAPAVFEKYIDDAAGTVDRLARSVCGDGFKVTGVRHGSTWLQLVAETANHPAAIGVGVGGVFWFTVRFLRVVFWYQERKLSIERQVAELNGLKSQMDTQKTLANAMAELTRRHVEALVMQFHRSAKNPDEANEAINLGMEALSTYARLYNEGLRVMLSSAASNEAKNELPVDAGGSLPAIPSAPIPLKSLNPDADRGDDAS